MDLTAILDDCLNRLATGETVASCLARYSDHVRDLEPLLRTAQQARALAELHLTYGQRTQGRRALRDVLIAQGKRSRPAVWRWLQPMPAALFLAAVLSVTAVTAAVAYSRPGDLAYPVRIVAERIGIAAQRSAQERAASEVDAADRRLSEFRATLVSTGEAHPLPLEALLRSEQAAATQAGALSVEERAALAARITAHLNELNALAEGVMDPVIAARLRETARRVQGILAQLEPPEEVVPVASATPTRSLDEAFPSKQTPSPTAAGREGPATRLPALTVQRPTIVISVSPASVPTRRLQPRPSIAAPLPAITPRVEPTTTLPVLPSATAPAPPRRSPKSTVAQWPSVTPSVWTQTPTSSAAVTPSITLTRQLTPPPTVDVTVTVFLTMTLTPSRPPTETPAPTATPSPVLLVTATAQAEGSSAVTEPLATSSISRPHR